MEKPKLTSAIILLAIFFTSLLPVVISSHDIIFDEYWYVPAAKAFIENRTYVRSEHPPLAQLLITSNIFLLGDNPLGWRLFSLIFGTFTLLSFYLLITTLTHDSFTALASTLLLAIEKMFITFSSLAVLDIFFLFFLITSFTLLLNKYYNLSSLTFALAANSKLTALFGIPVFIIFYFLSSRNIKRSKRHIIFWLITTLLLFFLIMNVLDRLYSSSNFTGLMPALQHLEYMLTTHISKNWSSSTNDPPWIWLINPNNYFLGNVSIIRENFLERSNPFIVGLSIISLPYSFLQYIIKRDKINLFIVLWTCFFYLIWFPIFFLFSRPLFSFYILPIIPVICLSNTIFFGKNRNLLIIYLLANISIFILFQYPFRLLYQ